MFAGAILGVHLQIVREFLWGQFWEFICRLFGDVVYFCEGYFDLKVYSCESYFCKSTCGLYAWGYFCM